MLLVQGNFELRLLWVLQKKKFKLNNDFTKNTSLLNNAPNYLIRCVIQNRLLPVRAAERSHKDLLRTKALGSPLSPLVLCICSRDAQLDCLSITEGGWPAEAVEDTSEAEADVTVDLGTGLGAAEVMEAKETPRSLGRAPFDGKVLLWERNNKK